MNNNVAHAIRVKAMKIAGELANFDRTTLPVREKDKRRGVIGRHLPPPDPTQWSYIDLDPLLGSVEEFLLDDGARATWPVDHAMCVPASDDWHDWRVVRGRTISTKEARGLMCRVFSPKMMRIEQVTFAEGRFDCGDANISYLGGRWVDSVRGPVSSAKDFMGGRNGSSQLHGDIGDVITGAALRLRYEWSAIFCFKNGLNLRFGTDAAGALALFRDRDKRIGEMRRSPLLHWVSRHWRRGIANPDIAHEVRKHLRGRENISWAGMDVTIIPADYEMELAGLK